MHTPTPTCFRIDVHPISPQHDTLGHTALRRLRDAGIASVSVVRSSRIYFLELAGDTEAAHRIARELLADPVSERAIVRQTDNSHPGTAFALEVFPRPGVMDPAVASAEQAIRDMGLAVVSVRTGTRYEMEPAPAPDLHRRLAAVLANDCVEEAIVGYRPPGPAPKPPQAPAGVRRIELREMSEDELAELSRGGHLFLSRDEMIAIREHFRAAGRDPTDLELETLAQTWSEHCIHKTLKSRIVYRGSPFPVFSAAGGVDAAAEANVEVRYENLLGETIGRATRELLAEGRGPQCLSVFKDNAGIIAFDDEVAIAFKVETHNHPSAIEPYGGAATGVGGCVRDIIGCGLAAQPIANTDVFCVAPPDWPVERTPRGIIHPRVVLNGVVAGVRDYGNRMGIPTVSGAVHFDPRYLGNPLVFCGCIGLIPRNRIEKAARPEDRIVLVGGRTGRDGIHGATFSSVELTDAHADEFSHAVQIGNAIEEKKFLDVILQARDHATGCLFSAITDCGAGGLSSAIGEMAAGLGAEVELERVPLKYAGLRYDEIWISESQERMVLAVPPERLDALLRLCAAEDVLAADLGAFTESGRLVVRHGGQVVGDLELDFLHHGLPKPTRRAEWRRLPAAFAAEETAPARRSADGAAGGLLGQLLGRLASPTVASKEWIVRQYDHEVQARTVVKPLVGTRQDGPGDAAVLRPRRGSVRGIAVGCGLCPQLSDLDPYWMAVAAIDEAIRNVVCVGGDPDRTAILDNFCWGRTDDPRQLGGLVRACQGCYDAAKVYGVPFISGKDSLNNEFALHPEDVPRVWDFICDTYGLPRDAPIEGSPSRIAVPGTLLISAVALIDDVRRCVTMDLKQTGSRLYLVGQPSRVGRSEPYGLPPFDPAAASQTHRAVAQMIREAVVRAVHDVSDGGLLVTLAEMAIAGDAPCRVHGLASWLDEADRHARSRSLRGGASEGAASFYFAESPGLYVVEVGHDRHERFAAITRDLPTLVLATVESDPERDSAWFAFRDPRAADGWAGAPVALLRETWKAPLRW